VHRPPFRSLPRLALSLNAALLGLAGCFGASSSANPAGPASDGAAGIEAGGVDASSAASEAGSDAAPGAAFEAGPGCQAPAGPATLSPSTAGVPASGLVLWLRADTGVYTVAADAGAASVDGAAPAPQVCAWADASGNGWVLQNPTASAPAWRSQGPGGHPAIEFASTTAALQTAGVLGLGATSPRTFIAVETMINAGARFEPVGQGLTGSAGTYIMIDANPYETAGNLEGVYMTSNAFDTATATAASMTRVHVYTVSAMTVGTPVVDSVSYRVNGAAQTLTLLPGGSDGTFQDFSAADFTSVGSSYTSTTGVPPDALVSEVLVYDRALSSSETTSVEAALQARYAPGAE
jgi:hypothetical protein